MAEGVDGMTGTGMAAGINGVGMCMGAVAKAGGEGMTSFIVIGN